MLYAGLDLSQAARRLHLLDRVRRLGRGDSAAPPDADALRASCAASGGHERAGAGGDRVDERRPLRARPARAGRLGRRDRRRGQKVKGLAPLACKTDKIDAWVLAELVRRDLVPAIWLPDPDVRARARAGPLPAPPGPPPHRAEEPHPRHPASPSAIPCPVSDLFGVAGRELLDRLELPEPWATNRRRESRPDRRARRRRSTRSKRELRALGADHPLRAAADDRARDRLGAGLHDRRRDRRHQPLRHPQEAGRLHRAVPAGPPVRRNATTAARCARTAPSTCAGR